MKNAFIEINSVSQRLAKLVYVIPKAAGLSFSLHLKTLKINRIIKHLMIFAPAGPQKIKIIPIKQQLS